MSFLVVMRPARDGVEDEHGLLQQQKASDPYGVGIFDLKERADVEAIVAADPAATSGLLTPEIRPMWIVTR